MTSFRLFTIPNILTLAGLLAGSVSIFYSLVQEMLPLACLFIVIAGLFDFLDGFSARLLGSYSLIGKELDSLADMVSFGVAPAASLFVLLKTQMGLDSIVWDTLGTMQRLYFAVPVMVVLFSALRLAKFNTDDRQSEAFIGLPTPAHAFLLSSLTFLLGRTTGALHSFIAAPAFIAVLATATSFLLISEMRMFSLKMKEFSMKWNYPRYIFLLVSMFLLAFWQFAALPVIILLYILSAPLVNFLFRKSPVNTQKTPGKISHI